MGAEPQTVRDVMTHELVTMGRNDKLVTANDVMRLGRIRHLPVLDEDGNLAGIVTQTDLFRGAVLRSLGYGTHTERRMLEALFVKDAMTTDVLTTTAETPLGEAARTMLERKVGCLVVVDGTRPIGILTESDFVKLSAK